MDVASLPWKEIAPGVKLKVLWRDEASGAATVLLSFTPGSQAPRHEHMGVDCFEDHDSVISAGNSAVRAAGSVHQGFTREGSLHLSFFSRPNRLIDTARQVQF